jgi:hypothetical protein
MSRKWEVSDGTVRSQANDELHPNGQADMICLSGTELKIVSSLRVTDEGK